MKYVGVKTTGELKLHEVKEPQTDEIYMAVEDTKLGAVPIRPYEFVKWDGTKWVKVDNVELATTLDIKDVEDEFAAIIPDGASEENKLATAADVAGVQEDVDTIEGKIPVDATSANKLVSVAALNSAIDSISSGFTPKGEASVSDINSLTDQSNGDSYILTDDGTLNGGALTVQAGDQVAWDSANEVWYKINSSTKDYTKNAFQVMPRCACVGDSLSAGYSTYSGDKITDNIAKKCGINWPSYIAKRNGIYFKNIAFEGATTTNFRKGVYLDSLKGVFDGFFVALGHNDRNSVTLGTSADIAVNKEDNALSFYGNYDFIVRKLHALCSSARIFVMTMPEFVTGSQSYNEAIRYISSLYSYVFLVDLAKESVYYTSWMQSLITDGTHFSPYGYEVASSVIEDCVNRLYADYGVNFKTFPKDADCFGVPGILFDSSREEYPNAIVDYKGRLIESMDKTGVRHFHTKIDPQKGILWNETSISELVEALRDSGYSI